MLELLAYLDPGTGSIIIQTVVGALAGLALFGRQSIKRVASSFRSLFNKRNSKDN